MKFTLEQAMRAMPSMRKALGLPEETFALPAFVGMLNDEIEDLRGAGKSDEDIASLIEEASGAKLSAQDIAENYASPEQRRRG